MHRGHDHHHHDLGGAGAIHFGPGHNHARAPHRVVQWQRPHLDDAQTHGADAHDHGEPDLDQIPPPGVNTRSSSVVSVSARVKLPHKAQNRRCWGCIMDMVENAVFSRW